MNTIESLTIDNLDRLEEKIVKLSRQKHEYRKLALFTMDSFHQLGHNFNPRTHQQQFMNCDEKVCVSFRETLEDIEK